LPVDLCGCETLPLNIKVRIRNISEKGAFGTKRVDIIEGEENGTMKRFITFTLHQI
jgi:hypothetical protein